MLTEYLSRIVHGTIQIGSRRFPHDPVFRLDERMFERFLLAKTVMSLTLFRKKRTCGIGRDGNAGSTIIRNDFS